MPRTKFKPDREVAYDKDPVCFKVKLGVKAKLKVVPNWPEQLRGFVDRLISGQDA